MALYGACLAHSYQLGACVTLQVLQGSGRAKAYKGGHRRPSVCGSPGGRGRRCRYIPPPVPGDKVPPPTPTFPCTPHSRRYQPRIGEYVRVSMSSFVGFCRFTAPHRGPFRCTFGPDPGPFAPRIRTRGAPSSHRRARCATPYVTRFVNRGDTSGFLANPSGSACSTMSHHRARSRSPR